LISAQLRGHDSVAISERQLAGLPPDNKPNAAASAALAMNNRP
jgi:hypothetical protein